MDNGKVERITIKIKVFGIVQGVGFRPLVYRLAKKYEITGNVRNVGGYVVIIAQAEKENIGVFCKELQADDQSACEIVKLEAEEIKAQEYTDFIIVGSLEDEEVSIIPPDLPICVQCRRELLEETDRRYQNPFISCMSCGPRYTIIEKLPYDRDNTTMQDFQMCGPCKTEYTSPSNRRFHAQTVSCNDCGPRLLYRDNTGTIQTLPQARQSPLELKHQEEYRDIKALEKATACINEGGIVAVKGIGGYHLVCTPFHEDTVQKLRALKGREEKPFAVMFETVLQIEKYCLVTDEEKALLETKARPIVLLYLHTDKLAPSVVTGSMYCGAFLPYTPLQLLLIQKCGPLIMTSANWSDQPIIKEDAVMLAVASPYLNGVLYHARRIVRSVDDSVAKIIDGKPQLIRRSRGYVPYPVFLEPDQVQGNKMSFNNQGIFAAGGDLKAAFCFYHNGKAVVSQHFGDLEEITVMEEYWKSFADLSRLLRITPTLAVCDLHPNYHSSKFAKALGLPVLRVQHHHAHIASVMAEHNLKGRIIGIAFDGTGYGTDGSIWGGEFFVCEGVDYVRAGKLSNTPMLGGDESMRDALKTATCFLLNHGLEEYVTDNRKDIIKAALKHQINTIQTTSAGRLFDAVASILDICQINAYEGECAAFLEKEAVLAIRKGINPEKLSFAIREESEIIVIDSKPMLEVLCRLRDCRDTGSLALGFHYALTAAIGEVCERLRSRYQSNTVALSGGVFQNSVLSQQTLKILRQMGFSVYVNLSVPPNDGGISLGQTYLGLKSKLFNNK